MPTAWILAVRITRGDSQSAPFLSDQDGSEPVGTRVQAIGTRLPYDSLVRTQTQDGSPSRRYVIVT